MKKQYFEDSTVIDKVFGEEKSEEKLTPPDFNKPAFKIMPDKADAIKGGTCPLCGKKIDAKDFKDESSKKEYSISGMCQKCQDKVFGED